ncbi:MAG: DNA mismatch repair endonuclease MutL, partial [Lachnospira sp.]|nr:DNA mismatch repair endonuclease MutL [Lachnospira sp.]
MAIQVLDQDTINKIAAGEVVERPSSVVKELVENAIDAGATAITVEIRDGGISMIRITDNGSGINGDEIRTAFLRHSTSKIKSVEDLLSVSSLGFRGEALSSIASVSQIELMTKTADSFTGFRYVIEGGKEVELSEVGIPDGTTFIVRNLFYNTPARRKFLKSPQTEAGYIASLVEHLALSHPDISFRFINNNQNKLHTSGNLNLKDIIYNVYGRDITNNLVEVNAKTQDIEITGFIGRPIISRGNRTYENYYINGRFIKSGIITKAIEEAYKGYIMPHNYPFTALHFTINPQILDVNVHPTKMELRFSKNDVVYNFVFDTIRDALKKIDLAVAVE